MDISSNSDLLTYARYNPDEGELNEDSFVVLGNVDTSDDENFNDAESNLAEAMKNSNISNGSVESQTSVVAGGSKMLGSEHDDDAEVSMEMKRMLEENQELKKKVRELNEQQTLLQSKFKEVADILTNVKQNRQEEQAKFEESRKDVEQAQKLIAELRGTIQSLEHEIDVKNFEVMNAKAAAPAQDLQSLENKLAATKDELQATFKRVKEVEELLNHERGQNVELKEALRRSLARSDATTSDNEENIRTLRTQVDEYQTKNMELNGKIVEKDDEIQILRGQLESSQLSLEEYRMAHEEKRAEISALNEARAKILTEVETLHHALATKSARFHELHQTAAEKECECNELRAKLEERQTAFQDVNLTNRKTEEICAKYQEKVWELTEQLRAREETGGASVEELAQLRAILQQKDEENSQLRLQVAALSGENESISHWRAQCEVYKLDFERISTENDELSAKFAEMTDEIAELKAKDQKLEKDLKELHEHHLRLAQEHVDRDEPESAQPSSSSANDPAPATEQNTSQQNSLPGESIQPAAAMNPEENQLPPCPVCGRTFDSYSKLARHCETCGESNSRVFNSYDSSTYGSHMDPFVFVPQQ